MTVDPGAAAGHGTTPPPRRSRWRIVVSTAVTVAVLAVVFLGIFPKVADYSEAWASIQQMPTAYIALLAIATLVNLTVYVWPLQAALPGLGYGPGFVVRQTSFAISNALLAGGIVEGSYLLLAAIGALAIGVAVVAFTVVLRSEGGARAVGRWADRLADRPCPSRRLTGKLLDFRSSVVDAMRTRWLQVTLSTLLLQLTSWAILVLALRPRCLPSFPSPRAAWARSTPPWWPC